MTGINTALRKAGFNPFATVIFSKGIITTNLPDGNKARQSSAYSLLYMSRNRTLAYRDMSLQRDCPQTKLLLIYIIQLKVNAK